MNFDELDVETLINLWESITTEGAMPQDMYVPELGWVIMNGVPTELGRQWHRELVKKGVLK